MDIRVLTYFLMVSKEENITKAAQILHVTQPTLSRQLHSLENELGVSLFNRSNHSIYLTEEGLLFRRRAQEIVNLSERAKSELTQTDDLEGEIEIGSVELQSSVELAEMITNFQKKYPKVSFNLRSGNNFDIKDWMTCGLIDLGLLIEPVDTSKFNFVRMNKQEEWGILAHKNSRFSDYDEIVPGDLVGTKVITISDEMVQQQLAIWSGVYAKDMHSKAKYNLIYNAAMMAKANDGIVISLKLNQNFEDLKFIPLVPKLTMHSVLAWQDQKPNSRVTNAFIEFVSDNTKS